jgi:hypothetical protein
MSKIENAISEAKKLEEGSLLYINDIESNVKLSNTGNMLISLVLEIDGEINWYLHPCCHSDTILLERRAEEYIPSSEEEFFEVGLKAMEMKKFPDITKMREALIKDWKDNPPHNHLHNATEDDITQVIYNLDEDTVKSEYLCIALIKAGHLDPNVIGKEIYVQNSKENGEILEKSV